MKRPVGLVAVTLLLSVFALIEVRVTNAQVQRRTVTYTDGSRYEGEIRNGQRHGHGTYTYPNGDRYEGQWLNGNRTGRGTYTWADGGRYVGQFRNGNYHGRGTRTWPNGNRYEGDWRDDEMHGQGTFTWADGTRHVGQLRSSNFHGRGTRTWPNGNRYEGDWRDDKMHGQGTYTWASGTRHVGEFRNDKLNGRGTRTWPDGSRYEGDWRDWKMHGQGTYTWPDGSRYVGELRNNKFHGRGTRIWPNGHRYEGDWRNDKRTGRGTYTWPDGDRYAGEFRNDKLHGQGIYTWADGSRHEGEWRNGKRVQGQQQRQRQAQRQQARNRAARERQSQGQQAQERQRQVQQRSQARARQDAASGQDLYGSIFYSREIGGRYAWGMAWDYDNLASARRRASAECKTRRGTGCSEILWFRNTCGALFLGDNGWGTGWGANKAKAESIAREYCKTYTSNCRLEVSRCATPRPPQQRAREQARQREAEERQRAQERQRQGQQARERQRQVQQRSQARARQDATSGQDLYGSIFYSREIGGRYAWGMAWDYDNLASARRRASAECKTRRGTGCSEILWFRSTCGALFLGDNGWGTGWGANKAKAESIAREYCKTYTSNCRLEVSRCATPRPPQQRAREQARQREAEERKRAQERQRQTQERKRQRTATKQSPDDSIYGAIAVSRFNRDNSTGIAWAYDEATASKVALQLCRFSLQKRANSDEKCTVVFTHRDICASITGHHGHDSRHYIVSGSGVEGGFTAAHNKCKEVSGARTCGLLYVTGCIGRYPPECNDHFLRVRQADVAATRCQGQQTTTGGECPWENFNKAKAEHRRCYHNHASSLLNPPE